jgi:hypothetical protein
MADYLAAEALIIQRLQSQVPGMKALSAADLADVAEAKQTTPAFHVLYHGDRLVDAQGRGQAQAVAQRWMIVITVRTARDQGKGGAARNTAGPHLDAALKALSGWEPDQSHGALRRVAAPRPVYSKGGFAYFPLAFETVVETLGTA